MNQPYQPAPDSTASAGQSLPLPVDSDPYYSIALNVPSGPVGSKSVPPALSQPGETDSTAPVLPAPQGHESFQAGIDLLNEIDIRTYQLEDPEPHAPELPMPIRNAFCVGITEASPSPETSETPNFVAQDESGRFIARENSVVYINGNDGFDYIDLSDRDVAHVTFGDSSMTVVDANTGESFTIEFQNVSRALFANGQMIELT